MNGLDCARTSLRLATAIALSLALAFGAADTLSDASEALLQGSPEEAVELLEAYLVASPASADGHRLLGVARSLLGQRSNALGALGRAAELEPRNPANHLARGQALAQFGEHADAREAFGEALRLDPELGPAYEGLALSLAVQGEVEEAVDRFTEALARTEEGPGRARLHYFRGRALAQLERFAKAAKDFEASTELNPRFGPAYLELGRVLEKDPDATGAESVLHEAAALLPNDFDAQYLYGAQLLRNARPAAAVEALRKAVALKPADRTAGYALGRALRAAGKTEEAVRVLKGLSRSTSERALDEARINEAGRINNLGLEAEAAGDFELALRRYEKAIEIAPGNVDFQRNAALALGRLERWNEAKERLRKVLEMAPGDSDATKALYIALEHAPD